MNTISKYLLTLGLLILSGCGVYSNQFQCRPGNGLRCVPAGEVVELIVEREEEEDLFLKNSAEAARIKEEQKVKKRASKIRQDSSKKLVMIKDEEGNLVLSPEADTNSYR